jgi:hypothetical protein
MMKTHTCDAPGAARLFLNAAILMLIAGGSVFTAIDAAAGKKGHSDQEQQGDGHHGHGHGGKGESGKGQVCSMTSQIAYKACGDDVQDNYLIALAKCLNVTDPTEKRACFADARSASQDERTQCGDVRDARLDVCGALTMGGGPYDPPIDPANFVPADQIVGNTYFPLKTGTKWVYNNTAGETITVTVTDQTAEIQDVPVRVVTDVVVDSDGKTTEDTMDWYAQDVDGNVWYFGENTMATNPDNMLISVEGAWETGVDGAKPGIIMPAVFTIGDVYRQEWLLGDAEDVAENLSMTENETTPAASCSGNCLKTHEYSPLEPDASESKFYAPNVGVIVTLDDNDPTFREELTEFTPAP